MQGEYLEMAFECVLPSAVSLIHCSLWFKNQDFPAELLEKSYDQLARLSVQCGVISLRDVLNHASLK